MKRNANVLEFFNNFFSGFLQVLLQCYIFMLHYNDQNLETKPRKFFETKIFDLNQFSGVILTEKDNTI